MNQTASDFNETPGQFIILHGTSSSGKSSTAKAITGKLEGNFLHIQLDTYLTNFFKNSPPGTRLTRDIVHGIHGEIAHDIGKLLKSGCNVILDTVCEQQRGMALFLGLQPYLVGLQPNLDVLKAREITRGDRSIGLAELQFSTIHENVPYNLVIDNSSMTAEQTADAIAAAYKQDRPNQNNHRPTTRGVDPSNGSGPAPSS